MLALVPNMRPTPADHLLHLEAEEDGNRAILRLRGEVDICTASRLRDRLAALLKGDGRSAVVLDLSGLEFMDATGLEVLVQAQLLAGARGTELVLAHPPGIVRRLLEVTGLEGTFPVEQTG